LISTECIFIDPDTGNYYTPVNVNQNPGVISMAEAVMGPVVAMLIGAVMIAAGLISASSLSVWIGIVLAMAGVATFIVGMIMLFGLAKEKNEC
jgi:hypothetical protein